MKTLLRLHAYMGNRKILLPGAVITSALSSLVGMIPFLCIWGIIHYLFKIGVNAATNEISTLAVIALGTSVLSILLYFLALTLSHLAAFRVETEMRSLAMRKIADLPLGFFDSNTSGKIRKIIDTNASVTHSFLAHQIPDLAGTFLLPITTLILIFIFDWRLGIACLLPVCLAMFIMSSMMGKHGKKFMKQYMNALEDMSTEAVEYVRGIPVVKTFQQTVFSFKSFHKSIIKYRDMVTAYTKMWERPMSKYIALIQGIIFFIVPAGVLLISLKGNPAEVIQDLLLYVLITPVFAQCIMRSAYLGQAQGLATEAINRLEEIVNYEKLPRSLHPRKISGHEISFKNVTFSYPNSSHKAVNSISFTVPEGTTAALVGSSGGGKTTIARLVPRFWDVEAGVVSIGGINVKDIDPKNLMQKISFVFQNTHLFKTSILENVRYGNPNATCTDIEHALALAQCQEIIAKLPRGLDTEIGVKGVYLSGGEQQRIILARAILKNAPIVILDEATAFADPESEYLIQEALSQLVKGKTVLMIAHRLTSVQNADQIYVVDDGRIVEQGTHQQLQEKQGNYLRMWEEYKRSVNWTIKKGVSHAQVN